MCTALVLQADGRRENGRWRRGSVVNLESKITGDDSFQDRLTEAGIVLDFKPDLAPDVVSGAITLNAAFEQG
ncbi:ParB N-terminal domain-containing protein [Mycobacterium canetti]|uniref:hypothetical protein n=1 Tax=Mycobacterium canetti TaxID=78331 RepID=UPI002D78467F|nr:hypothetical protein [Mycobacterium canetti]WRO42733.1 ParB N-terminal domain-containing protein [Mycobacterium canetti]